MDSNARPFHFFFTSHSLISPIRLAICFIPFISLDSMRFSFHRKRRVSQQLMPSIFICLLVLGFLRISSPTSFPQIWASPSSQQSPIHIQCIEKKSEG